jgi:LysM repeat protein
MQFSPRTMVVAAIGFAPLVLASGCGTEASGSQAGLTPIQGTSYVTIEPATTTTTVAVAESSEPGRSPTEQIYTVVAGDSVYKIAEKHDVDPDVLASYNEWPEGVFHPLQIGDEVKIPPDAAVPGAGSSDSSGGDTGGGDTGGGDTGGGTDTGAGDDGGDSTTGCSHTVVSGDNPSRVANQYDVTLDELNAANASNPAYTQFLIGQQINIPPGGSC